MWSTENDRNVASLLSISLIRGCSSAWREDQKTNPSCRCSCAGQWSARRPLCFAEAMAGVTMMMLTWNRREKEWTEDRQLYGCYHLRSSLDMSEQELWKLYITLTRVEDAFRHMKSDWGLGPFHHQLDRRCQAHIWITILANHLLRWTEYSLQFAGYQCTWRVLRRKLQTHCYATVIVPITTRLVHHTRKPGRPTEVQRLIYSLLGIDWNTLPIRHRTYRSQ